MSLLFTISSLADGVIYLPLIFRSGNDVGPPETDKIAFVSVRDGRTEIYVISSDGSDLTRLTDFPGCKYYPIWSPDRTGIIFEYREDCAHNREVYYVNADGTGLRNLTNNPADDYWNSLYLATWAPDSQKIAFVSKRGGNPDIYVTNIDGSATTSLAQSLDNEIDPSWSPDGKKIAFALAGSIHIMDADGENQMRIGGYSWYDERYPVWSPDGTLIAFTANRNGGGDRAIYVMGADGSKPTRLTGGLGATEKPIWSPGGEKIAYTRQNPQPWSDVYYVDADGTPTAQCVTCNQDGPNWRPSWSPNSTRFVFDSTREGTTAIYIIDIDGMNEFRLTGEWCCPAWSS